MYPTLYVGSEQEHELLSLDRIITKFQSAIPFSFCEGKELLPERETTPPKIISVAHILPMKARAVLLQTFAIFIKKLNVDTPTLNLQVVGSCRNDGDEIRLQDLKDLGCV
ncbi:unnamed protein product [Lactuca saligna]|uniref:Uncharacterized protein n=1 Tax=Lactuca saligna TaxID=75948 RepID=A0AA35YH94_LACSI|nr:unnamed protein product [Lactuca saligna]